MSAAEGMVIVGVDLASQPAATGLACLRHRGGTWVIDDAGVGAGDEQVHAAVASARRAGVDVPFGWPAPFVDLLRAHRTDEVDPALAVDRDWRRPLVWRATDLYVHQRTGVAPLSVATDKIAYPALRWAGLAAGLRAAGLDMARDGTGAACEVYPAAALRIWGLPHRGYKGAAGRGVRARIIAGLGELLPALHWNGHERVCLEQDDALDAVLSAVIAANVAAGQYQPPPAELRPRALEEGWICLPLNN